MNVGDFDRYAPIIDDFQAFNEALERPLPRVLWANPLRRDPAKIDAEILDLCSQAVPVPWKEHAWRLPPDTRPGHWLIHVLGDIYVQEEAAMLAGDLVGARPGERVLDMCAAPGGKSLQLAASMADQGTLVLNEKRFARLAGLRRNVERFGLTCATVSQNDGARIPIPEIAFDRILVDAPCSCEGTSRKKIGRRIRTDSHDRDVIVQVQVSLLRRAMKLVKPGGTVIYSTCTYAPEENEAVLDRIRPKDGVIEPIQLPPGLRATPGITTWNGARYRDDVSQAIRVWPHLNDTGGFFIAKFRRI